MRKGSLCPNSPTVTAEKAFWRNLFHIKNTVIRITINGEKTSILVPKQKVAQSVLEKRQVSLGEIAQMSAQKADNIDAAYKILSSIKDHNQQKTFIDNMIKQANETGRNTEIEFAAKVVCAYLKQCSSGIPKQFIETAILDLKNGSLNNYQFYSDLTAILVKEDKRLTITNIINCVCDHESNKNYDNILLAITTQI